MQPAWHTLLSLFLMLSMDDMLLRVIMVSYSRCEIMYPVCIWELITYSPLKSLSQRAGETLQHGDGQVWPGSSSEGWASSVSSGFCLKADPSTRLKWQNAFRTLLLFLLHSSIISLTWSLLSSGNRRPNWGTLEPCLSPWQRCPADNHCLVD